MNGTRAAAGFLVAALLLTGCASRSGEPATSSPSVSLGDEAPAPTATSDPALSDEDPEVVAAEAGFKALIAASDAAFQAGFSDPALNDAVLRLTPSDDLDHQVAGIAAMRRYGVAKVGDTQVRSVRAIEHVGDPSRSGGSIVTLTACVDRTATDLVFVETGVSMDTVADLAPYRGVGLVQVRMQDRPDGEWRVERIDPGPEGSC
ncbi:hypothetical protein [Cellulomonas sp. URHE0023]|uniref:hypothetical protein n=1 Tax=Cellulomonas sp. URHE0023 TaxID=1380354 RepID=UPI000480277F|nr:hypothetical protein [Cellulomonas sp. URHE0023]